MTIAAKSNMIFICLDFIAIISSLKHPLTPKITAFRIAEAGFVVKIYILAPGRKGFGTEVQGYLVSHCLSYISVLDTFEHGGI